MRRLLAFLRQPYPVLDAPADQLRRAGLIGLFVGGFLLVFQPFGLSEWHPAYKALKIGGFGLISTLVTASWHVAWPAVAPRFFVENRWTVGRAALFLNGNILLIAVANVLYLAALQDVRVGAGWLAWMISATFLLGLFPAAGVTVATYVRELRRHQTGAARVAATEPPPATDGFGAYEEPVTISGVTTKNVTPEIVTPAALAFTADNGRDTLTLPVAHLLYLEAADNYCTVAYGSPDVTPTRALLRASLSRLVGQAAEQGIHRLTRVHRSYLVNLDRVGRVSGNAQGYRLHLTAPDVEPVPVGRTYAEAVLAALREVRTGPNPAEQRL